MNILMVISEAPPVKSGVARVAEKLSKGLQARGHYVDVISRNDIPRLECGEIRISSMTFRLPQIKQRLRDYDIIHLHGPVPTFSDVFLLRGLRGMDFARPRLVYTHHAPVVFQNKITRPFTWIYNFLQEKSARLADHVVVTTPSYNQRLARHVTAGNLSVIPWGVDYSRFHAPPQKDGPFTALYLGQIRPYKGLPVLLKAIQGITGLRLWVIGDGHYREMSQELANKLDLPDVTFWGSLPDNEMIALLKKAHVIVLPSVTPSEAFGIALLEGMAGGLVPVASHLPGVVDVVGNEGITFQPGEHRALGEILRRLRDDPTLRTHLASLAQAKARLYSWERVIFGYERIFENLAMKLAPRAIFGVPEIPTQPVLQGTYE